MDIFDEKFLAFDGGLDLSKYVVCEYVFQTGDNPLGAAIELCQSQSTSSAGWEGSARVGGETDEIVDEFGAKLLHFEIIEESETPDIPLVNDVQKSRDGKYKRVNAKMALPIYNLISRDGRASTPILFTAAAGEIHYLPKFISVKWTDIQFPDEYLRCYNGPSFGADGIRDLSRTTSDDPLVIAVVKPSLCPPEQFACLVYEAAMGGAHMVKEDELLVDLRASPLEERVKLAVAAVRRAEDATGRKILYQPNITDDVSGLERNYEIAIRNGADSVMVNGMAIGLSAVKMVAGWGKVPIASHFDLTACMAKVPYHGISHKVLATAHRMSGVDNLVVPAYGNTMMEYRKDIDDEIKACSSSLGNIRHSLPFLGGGVKATNIPYILRNAGTNNVGLIIGHGIYAHPDGPTAGTKSVVQAVEAYKRGAGLAEYARGHKELARAIEKWRVEE